MNAIKISIAVACSLGFATMAHAQADQASQQAVPNLAAHAADNYRSQARFPAWSQPVAKGMPDPVLEKRKATRQTLPRETGDGMTVWPSDMRFEKGETAYIHATIEPAQDDDADSLMIPREGLSKTGWTMSAVVTGQLSGVLGEIVLRDDGVGGDARALDGVYTGAFTLPEAFEPLDGYAENLAIVVTAQNGQNDSFKGITGILYSNPAARLTGRYAHELVDGDLIVRAEVDVETQGRFHLSGTLHDMKGEPLVASQNAVELEPGTAWIDLNFYGLALREAGAKGPLSLGSVTLATANGLPNALGPVQQDAYRTGPMTPAQFHARPFARADLLEQARRLEALSKEREKSGHNNR